MGRNARSLKVDLIKRRGKKENRSNDLRVCRVSLDRFMIILPVEKWGGHEFPMARQGELGENQGQNILSRLAV